MVRMAVPDRQKPRRFFGRFDLAPSGPCCRRAPQQLCPQSSVVVFVCGTAPRKVPGTAPPSPRSVPWWSLAVCNFDCGWQRVISVPQPDQRAGQAFFARRCSPTSRENKQSGGLLPWLQLGHPPHRPGPAPLLTQVLALRFTAAPVLGSLDPAPSRLFLLMGSPAVPPAISVEPLRPTNLGPRPCHSSQPSAHSAPAILAVGGREPAASHDRAGERGRFCRSSLGEQQAPPSRKVPPMRVDFGCS
ncbi:hypothetical protein NDU88_003554 [Pleurodeles waltl]|uniref:Uncharacterized protein n=1 Tax=Pleurodeles waltl TaxID=8319 RepID=A0AAV7NJK9_PLEWA|nr:hypothetical protein NDU88_003554 [Pleurodeles waltl]